MYSLPKFALLLTGAATLVPLITWNAMLGTKLGKPKGRWLASRQVLLVSLFSIVVTISTILGVAPVAGVFGSSYNQMGLITHICFFIVFVSLIVVNGSSDERFRITLWAITLTGLVVATYAFMQFFGRDPFLQPQTYTFESHVGPILRVNSTVGHSNYLGNFLLYIAPLAAGLGLGSHGRARRIGLITAVLSAIAIVFTGTRGAWLGLVVAALVFAALAKSHVSANLTEHSYRRQVILWAGVASVVLVILSAIVAFNPASRSIVHRASSLIHEDTGSGRTLLWRDSIKMIPEFALVGCGPEGFRRAFLPYKSVELSRLAPDTNNESSHNSYIDAALSYGLPGAILYVAIIATSISQLMYAHRRATNNSTRMILLSLVSSLAGIVVHNFFIFDQISTGLYFFTFAALAQISNNLSTGDSENQADALVTFARVENATKRRAMRPQHTSAGQALDSTQQNSTSTTRARLSPILLIAACVLAIVAAWYSIAISQADIQISRAIASAAAGDFDGVLAHGSKAISHPDPAGDYSFLLASALALWADNSFATREHPGKPEPNDLASTRNVALNLAMSHAEESLAHTLTRDSSYVLLAYIALRVGEGEKLFAYASEAVRSDPNFSNSHWLMAEAYLARNELEPAAHEANFALHLNPNSHQGRSALKRAKGMPESTDDLGKLIHYAQTLSNAGKFEKARRFLLRALRKSDSPCADCHRALASLYESAELYPEAISEWEAFALSSPDRALAEGTKSRIERLRRAEARQH